MTDNSRIRQRFDLTGKVALLTGASKGIGEAMARGMAEFGATMVVSSRRQETVDAVAADDVAGLATLLGSDATACCSGGAYTVDGGYLAN